MINLSNTKIDKICMHYIGNKSNLSKIVYIMI